MSFTATLLASQEVAQVCALFARVFGQPMQPAAWHWKYAQGPRLSGINVVVHGTQGELLGHAGASVFAGLAGGKPVPMAQICDVMVDPAARGGLAPNGVYGRLIEGLQQELKRRHPGVYAYGFAGIRPYKLGVRMGYYRLLDECRADYFVAPQKRTAWHAWPWCVQPIGFADVRLDRLWQRLAKSVTRPTVAKTAAYLQWRYAQHPLHQYRLWLLRHWGCEQGWFVTRYLPDGKLWVVDSLQQLAAPPAALALYRASLEPARQSDKLWAWCNQTWQRSALEPVMGCEVRVGDWHLDLPAPLFQPGDSDVY